MQAPEWASYLSIVDGALNPMHLCDLDQSMLKEVDLDQPMLKEVVAEKCGLVSYIPNQCIFYQKRAHQITGLSNIVGV